MGVAHESLCKSILVGAVVALCQGPDTPPPLSSHRKPRGTGPRDFGVGPGGYIYSFHSLYPGDELGEGGGWRFDERRDWCFATLYDIWDLCTALSGRLVLS